MTDIAISDEIVFFVAAALGMMGLMMGFEVTRIGRIPQFLIPSTFPAGIFIPHQHGSPDSILRSKDLSVGAKLTYSMLLSYAWQNDFCFPGQETLAGDMGVSRRSIVTFIKELQTRDCISVKRQGLNKPNIYTLHLTIKEKRR